MQLSCIFQFLSNMAPWASVLLSIIAAGCLVTTQIGEIINDPDLLDFEKFQLTDKVISNLVQSQDQTDLVDLLPTLSFGDYHHFNRPTTAGSGFNSKKCKTYPGDRDWPSDRTWSLFDHLLGKNALIKTVPEASICYPTYQSPLNQTIPNQNNYSPVKCESLTTSWNNSTLRIADPTSIRSILFQGMTCMPPNYTASFLGNQLGVCTVGGFPSYTVNVSSVAQIQLAVNIARELGIRLVIKNTGHDFGGKSTGMGGLSLWTHWLKKWKFFDEFTSVDGSYKGPAFQFGAGIQAGEAFEIAKKNGVTIVGGEGKVSTYLFSRLVFRDDEEEKSVTVRADLSIADCWNYRRIYPRGRTLPPDVHLRDGSRPCVVCQPGDRRRTVHHGRRRNQPRHLLGRPWRRGFHLRSSHLDGGQGVSQAHDHHHDV